MILVTEHFDLDETVPEPNVEREQRTGRRWSLPAGMPFLFDVVAAEIVTPVLLYCRYKFAAPGAYQRGVWTKLNSAEAAVSDLKDWWCKLHERQIPWNVADDDLLAEWLIDLHTLVSGRTKDFLADSTVARRAASISDFYRWALDEGLVEGAPTVSASKRLAKAKWAASRTGSSSREWTRYEGDPHPLDAKIVPNIAELLGPLPSEICDKWKPDPHVPNSTWRKEPDRTVRTSRDRLAFELGLACGMRIDEILNLDSCVFQDFEADPDKPFQLFELTITRTKGLVPREVFIPFWLMSEIAAYIGSERRVAISEAQRIWAISTNASRLPTRLLVNAPGSGRHVGKAATADTIEAAFHKACLRLNLVSRKPRAIGREDAHVVDVVKHTFHDTRHTFAVWMYHALERIEIQRPWIRIQKLLGHASVSTTIGTYLKVLDAFGPETLERLGMTFQAMRDRWHQDDGVTVH